MSFPIVRPRRLRRNQQIRDLVAETTLTLHDLLYPMFVVEGKNQTQPISSMPGINRYSVDILVEECKQIAGMGIRAVMFFGLPASKDPLGRGAYAENGIIQRALRSVKKAVPELILVPDVCLCEYTDHGHCGVLENGQVHNDATLELLAKTAVSYARAGADIVAPSDMMDGRIGEIREALDEADFSHIAIMSYAAKYAGAFYGPFREAADSAPQSGDRKAYQMDPRNGTEALREAMLDMEEGADILMVKPALPYLDVLSRIREQFDLPLAAYQVSGEYAMIAAAAQNGWLDYEAVIMESLVCIKRAGADIILTYFAPQAAQMLK